MRLTEWLSVNNYTEEFVDIVTNKCKFTLNLLKQGLETFGRDPYALEFLLGSFISPRMLKAAKAWRVYLTTVKPVSLRLAVSDKRHKLVPADQPSAAQLHLVGKWTSIQRDRLQQAEALLNWKIDEGVLI